MRWSEIKLEDYYSKGSKSGDIKDENERFITGNVGNNNTANGPGAILSIPAFTRISPFATNPWQLQLTYFDSLNVLFCKLNILCMNYLCYLMSLRQLYRFVD